MPMISVSVMVVAAQGGSGLMETGRSVPEPHFNRRHFQSYFDVSRCVMILVLTHKS